MPRWCRVMEATVQSWDDSRELYEVVLKLSPQPPPLTCALARSGMSTADSYPSIGPWSVATPSVSITPPSGGPVILYGAMGAYDHNAPGAHWGTAGAGFTALDVPTRYPNDMSPAFMCEYRAVASPSGSYTVESNFSPGYNGGIQSYWLQFALAFRTSATGPTQQVKNDTGNPMAMTLPGSPTAGSLLILTVLGMGSGATGAATVGAGWTHVLGGDPDDTRLRMDVWLRCVNEGDPASYNVNVAGSLFNWANLSEWAVE